MGYAIPAAIAARLVYPARTAVAVCGDGGFSIGLNGLLTAVEEQIPIVVVIFDNAMLGWVRHGQQERPIASQFGPFDYAAIARRDGLRRHARERPGRVVGGAGGGSGRTGRRRWSTSSRLVESPSAT